MSQTVDPVSRVIPSAAPDDADIAAWQDLPREEQLLRLRSRLTQADCSMPSSASMDDILNRAQAGTKRRHG